MFNKDLINKYKNIKMPDNIKNNIYKNIQNIKISAKPNLKIKRRVFIYAAVFISMILVVSATAIIYNSTQYIPFKGFVEGDYEIYSTPEVLPLGKATIDTITRVKNGDSSELSIIITDLYNLYNESIKIITEDHGEFDLNPAIKYDNFNYGYYIENFPEINKFIISGNGESIEANLELNKPDNVIIAENSNVTIKSYNMSAGSRIFAFNAEERNFNIEKILGIPEKNPEKNPYDLLDDSYFIPDGEIFAYKVISIIDNLNIYDQKNEKFEYFGYTASIAPDKLGSLMIFDKVPENKLSKITTNNIGVMLRFTQSTNIYSDVNIPVPTYGEEIVFDDGLVIYDHNGLTCTVKWVKYNQNGLTFWADTVYTGNGSEYIDRIYIDWRQEWGGHGGSWDAGAVINSFDIKKGEEQIMVKMMGINYIVNGNWEINFN